MKIIIDIPEKTYQKIKEGIYDYGDMNVIIQNGTPYEKQPHGEWTSNGDDLEAICSVCGEALPYSDEYDYETNFCPNCGADMRKEGEAE